MGLGFTNAVLVKTAFINHIYKCGHLPRSLMVIGVEDKGEGDGGSCGGGGAGK